MISIARPLLGDEEAAAVLHVLASGQLAQGEQVAIFERVLQNCAVCAKQWPSLLELLRSILPY